MTKKIFFGVIVMMIVGSGTYGAVSDHVLKIEMSSTYNYDFPGILLHYDFDAWIQVDATVVSGSLQVPSGSVYPMVYESDGVETWLGVYSNGSDPSVWDDFGAGTYTFTVNYISGPSDSTSIDYQLPNGDPIPYVTQEPQFVYPQHDAVDVPLDCTLQFDPATNPDHTIDIWIDPLGGTPGALSYDIGGLSHDTSSYGPVTLSPETLYEGGYSINYYVNMINADGIPTEMDTDAETQIQFTTGIGIPETMLDGLKAYILEQVSLGGIDAKLKDALLAKVNAALSALDRGNTNDAKVATNELNALISQVNAQTNKKITPEVAAIIIESANAIIAILAG